MVKISNNDIEGVHEIVVNGEIDASSSIHLDNALEEAFKSHKKILIDLNDLSYISSAGLGVFIARLEEIKENKITMILFGMNEKVKNVFSILGLEELLMIKDNRQEAVKEFE